MCIISRDDNRDERQTGVKLTMPWPPTNPNSDWRRDKPLHVETARMRRWGARSATLFVSALVDRSLQCSSAGLLVKSVDGWLAQPPSRPNGQIVDAIACSRSEGQSVRSPAFRHRSGFAPGMLRPDRARSGSPASRHRIQQQTGGEEEGMGRRRSNSPLRNGLCLAYQTPTHQPTLTEEEYGS